MAMEAGRSPAADLTCRFATTTQQLPSSLHLLPPHRQRRRMPRQGRRRGILGTLEVVEPKRAEQVDIREVGTNKVAVVVKGDGVDQSGLLIGRPLFGGRYRKTSRMPL